MNKEIHFKHVKVFWLCFWGSDKHIRTKLAKSLSSIKSVKVSKRINFFELACLQSVGNHFDSEASYECETGGSHIGWDLKLFLAQTKPRKWKV